MDAPMHKKTYALVIYTALCTMFWMGAYTLLGEVGGGWALEFPSFLGPKCNSTIGSFPFHTPLKKVREFPVPSRDVITKLSLGGNNDVITELFLPRGSLVSDIPAGDGKLVNLFLRCRAQKTREFQGPTPSHFPT